MLCQQGVSQVARASCPSNQEPSEEEGNTHCTFTQARSCASLLIVFIIILVLILLFIVLYIFFFFELNLQESSPLCLGEQVQVLATQAKLMQGR